MTRVLVTGGTGVLGRRIVAGLDDAGFTPRVMSRQPRHDTGTSDREWVQADLASGDGLANAVRDVDVVVHAASDPRNSAVVDVEGTRALLQHATDANVDRFVYVSIVGIDAWESGWFPYYRHKLAAERAVEASTLETTIQRATQFHPFLDLGFRTLRWVPVWPLPTPWILQPVAVREVADRLVELVATGATGRVPDFGGPESLTVRDLAKTWQSVRAVRRPVVRVPIPGTIAARVRDGAMTLEDGIEGRESWRDWLERGIEEY